MQKVILTSEEDLRSIVSDVVSKVMPVPTPKKEIDTINTEAALLILSEYGYPVSKAKLYKLTASGEIPCRKFGQKLVFSKKDILSWAESLTKPKNNSEETTLILARSANRKR